MVDPFILGNQLSSLLLDNQDVTIDDFSCKNLKIRDKDHLLFVISTSCLIKQTHIKLKKMLKLVLDHAQCEMTLKANKLWFKESD